MINKSMDSTRGGSNRKTSLLSLQRRAPPLMSRWSPEDERLLFGDQRRHRHGSMNYVYDFPIEKWSERRIAAEKREIEKSSSFNTKPSSRCKQTTKSPKDPDGMLLNGQPGTNPRLTICSLLHHCESIADFEGFKVRSLIAAFMNHPNRTGPKQQITEEAKTGKAAHHVGQASMERDAEDDGCTDDKASSPSMMGKNKMTSADPVEMTSDHPEQSLGRNPSSDENGISDSLERLNSDSVSRSNSIHGLSASDSTKLHDESGSSTFKSEQQKKPELPVRFYYTRLNAEVQGRLNQLNQLNHHGAMAFFDWKSTAHPPLPFLTPPTNPDQYHSSDLVQSSPRYLSSAGGVSSSAQPCLTSMARGLNSYPTSDAVYSASGVLSKPMTKQNVLAALARVRFQTEGPNASAVLLPPALPPNRQATRKLCGEEPPPQQQQQQQQQQQREASADLEARGQTCVIHDSSSTNVDAVSKVQMFHIGDLLQAMERNQRRETPLPSYLGSSAADISL